MDIHEENRRFEARFTRLSGIEKQISEDRIFYYGDAAEDGSPGLASEYQWMWMAWQARAAECQVPEGWVLAPSALTQNMADAAKFVDSRLSVWGWADAYKVMLDAAPQPDQESATEAESDQLIKERDYWEEKATELAEAVGAHFGFEVGEHSSANCPVQSAIDQLNEIQSAPDPEQPYISLATDDDVERIAKAAGWDNRKFMSQPDYAFWCERMREFARLCTLQQNQKPNNFDLESHLNRQIKFSEKTFGPGSRTKGIIDHIRKELNEILESPQDVEEWVDVIILGFDGAWRAGFTAKQIIESMVAKQAKNEGRDWPDWRQADRDKAIEHQRDGGNSNAQFVEKSASFVSIPESINDARAMAIVGLRWLSENAPDELNSDPSEPLSLRGCLESIYRHLEGETSALATAIKATCEAGLGYRPEGDDNA